MSSLNHTTRPPWKRPRFGQRTSRNPSGIFRLDRVRLSKKFLAITENGEPSLLKFPPEVRLIIYNFIAAGTTRKLVYDDKHEKDFWEYRGDKDENDLPPLWALALTCFTVYQEAMPVIYRDMLVSMSVDKAFFTSKSADRLSQTAILQLVRHVSLKISVSPDMPESLLLVYKMFDYCKDLDTFNDIIPISKRQWVPVSAGEDMGVAHLVGESSPGPFVENFSAKMKAWNAKREAAKARLKGTILQLQIPNQMFAPVPRDEIGQLVAGKPLSFWNRGLS